MKILQINAVYGTKSTGRIVMEMHSYFKKMGHESYVAYANENTDNGMDKNIFQIGNILDHKLHAIAYRIDKKQGLHSNYASRALVNKIKKISPNCVILHNLHSNYINIEILLMGLKKMNIPVTIVLHDCWFFTGGCYHYTAQKCNNWLTGCHNCDIYGKTAAWKYNLNLKLISEVKPKIIAISKWLEREARKSFFNKECEIYQIYNWIDHTVFYPRNVDHIKDKYKLNVKNVILGVSGAWHSNKGINEMIEIANGFPEAIVILVGNKNKKVVYPENVITVNFTNSKDELAELYSLADVFVNPSKQETFGLVTGEALSCGTPVVVYNNTACPEFVDEYTGVIIDQNGVIAAVNKIFERIKLYGREFIKNKCLEFSKKHFDKDTQISAYLNALELQ